MRPFRLSYIPDYTIWGADHISKARNIDKAYGTWWEVSAHPYCSNQIVNMDDKPTLLELIKQEPDMILGPGYTLHETLRLAYLDTKDALSIQVHPEDNYAYQYDQDFGKYESWYIIDAKKGATLVAGTNIDDPEKIKQALDDHTIENYLCKWEVKKGDYIVIPSGMLHALGKDILALEVGTNSNTTFRFYDYDRKDKDGNLRQLHLKESFDVTDFSLKPTFVKACDKTHNLIDGPYFKVDELYLDHDETLNCDDHYIIISNIDNDTKIIWNDEIIELPRYDSLFVPYTSRSITIRSGAHVLVSIPRKEQ